MVAQKRNPSKLKICLQKKAPHDCTCPFTLGGKRLSLWCRFRPQYLLGGHAIFAVVWQGLKLSPTTQLSPRFTFAAASRPYQAVHHTVTACATKELCGLKRGEGGCHKALGTEWRTS
ncbi:hypothetical protein EV356DRAFT_257846 [Viridothelium virens]|uniref:Uncharacterized protein n=1 Tax=Viridothelium virens TaxID=1048519 RepID=A0A6A6H3P7_VIRVR|nr:hypothetical protein EV356DRAFT_257846 [Viridothelium virens]